jgi:hypothetical protein
MGIKNFYRLVISSVIAILFISHTWANQPTNSLVTYYQSQARYDFGQKLLSLALSKSEQDYAIHAFIKYPINEARGEKMVVNGEFDVQWLSTSQEREDSMIAIKSPIYKGILGLRLLLVKKQRKAVLSQIKTLQELQQYKGGHGSHWGDLPVYAHNGLPVHTNTSYTPLFLQLADDRFDYFHRGLNEIWQEQNKYSETLNIADNVMLFYPQPVYFFVSKKRPKLAEELKIGLERAQHDGSYKALFLAQNSEYIQKAGFNNRTLIRLKNPTLPVNTPAIDTHWWLPKTFDIK